MAGLARSTFYYQQKALQTADKYADLKVKIRTLFNQHKGRYDYRRITAAIRRDGHLIDHKTVRRDAYSTQRSEIPLATRVFRHWAGSCVCRDG